MSMSFKCIPYEQHAKEQFCNTATHPLPLQKKKKNSGLEEKYKGFFVKNLKLSDLSA